MVSVAGHEIGILFECDPRRVAVLDDAPGFVEREHAENRSDRTGRHVAGTADAACRVFPGTLRIPPDTVGAPWLAGSQKVRGSIPLGSISRIRLNQAASHSSNASADPSAGCR